MDRGWPLVDDCLKMVFEEVEPEDLFRLACVDRRSRRLVSQLTRYQECQMIYGAKFRETIWKMGSYMMEADLDPTEYRVNERFMLACSLGFLSIVQSLYARHSLSLGRNLDCSLMGACFRRQLKVAQWLITLTPIPPYNYSAYTLQQFHQLSLSF